MANVFVALPRPAGNGPGASVSTATMGFLKTIVIGSSGGVYEPVVVVEYSNDSGVTWSPIATFNGQNSITVNVSCQLMRMNVSRFVDGSVPVVDVGAGPDTATTVTLAVPAGNGSGASTSTAALGQAVTVQVGGPFGGTLNVEISEDGGTTWGPAFSFVSGGPSGQSAIFTAELMRVTRSGVPVVSPGLPDVTVTTTSAGGGGGGGGGGGTAFVYTATGLEGSSFTVTMPTPRADTGYGVIAMGNGMARLLVFDCPSSSFTITNFTCNASGNLTASDTILFVVFELA